MSENALGFNIDEMELDIEENPLDFAPLVISNKVLNNNNNISVTKKPQYKNQSFDSGGRVGAHRLKADEGGILKAGPEFRNQRTYELNHTTICSLDDEGVEEMYEFRPVLDFNEMGLYGPLLDKLRTNYTDGPTSVQSLAIPYLLGDSPMNQRDSLRDVVIRSTPGSGKSAAFLIPIIHHIDLIKENIEEICGNRASTNNAPYAIIISPTRELAIQMVKEAQYLAEGTKVRVAFAIGQVSMRDTMDVIRSGCDIVIGTVGRLVHFFYGATIEESLNATTVTDRGDQPILTFENVCFLVVDECDKMDGISGKLDYYESVKMIHTSMQLNPGTRTIMVSATIDFKHSVALRMLYNKIAIVVGKDMPSQSVVQQFFNVRQAIPHSKMTYLLELLKPYVDPVTGRVPKTMVYAETRRKCDRIAIYLIMKGYLAISINGCRSMDIRDRVMNRFRSGDIDILVVTDVFCRGVNIPDIELVVNYDLPLQRHEEYVHRVGRAGRVGNVGKCISFYDPAVDADIASGLVKVLENNNQPVPDFLENARTHMCDTFLKDCVKMGKITSAESSEIIIPAMPNMVKLPEGMMFV